MKNKLGLGALGVWSSIAGLLLAAPASAADPVVAGTTNMGTHPLYGSGYSAFWRTGQDYSVLTDGANSFFNAPSVDGAVYLRGNNQDWFSVTKSGAYLNSQRFTNSYLSVGADAVAMIGNHPSYASNYVGFWLGTPNCFNCPPVWDYSLLTDGTNTYVNAPNANNGTVYFRAGNVTKMEIGASGGLRLNSGVAQKSGGGSWTALSDARVKKDVVDFKGGLDELERVRPVSYRYNGLGEMTDTDTRYVGVIAQELERVLPAMVTKESKKLHATDKQLTELKQVDPSEFTYLLINAVKDLSQQNKELKRLVCQDHPTEAICAKVVAPK